MARSTGAVLVYPEPLSGHWVDVSGPEPNRDAHFVRDLIAKLVSHRIVNPNKIFLAGIGNGGIVALQLACEGKQKFAGVAVVSASLPRELEASCTPPGPVPLLMIHRPAETPVASQGTTDQLPHGAPELLSVESTLALFGKAAGCAGGATTSLVSAKEIHEGARAYIDKLNHCAVPVEAIRIEGGRTVPSFKGETEAGAGLANGALNSGKLVWDFFRRLGG